MGKLLTNLSHWKDHIFRNSVRWEQPSLCIKNNNNQFICMHAYGKPDMILHLL